MRGQETGRKAKLLTLAVTIAIARLAFAILVFQPRVGGPPMSITTSTFPPGAVQYTTNSPLTSQWLTVRASIAIGSVTSSNTGVIPAFYSSASLNATIIGDSCESVEAGGQCSSWKYLQQTGWYWDQTNELLYIHYLGG